MHPYDNYNDLTYPGRYYNYNQSVPNYGVWRTEWNIPNNILFIIEIGYWLLVIGN